MQTIVVHDITKQYVVRNTRTPVTILTSNGPIPEYPFVGYVKYADGDIKFYHWNKFGNPKCTNQPFIEKAPIAIQGVLFVQVVGERPFKTTFWDGTTDEVMERMNRYLLDSPEMWRKWTHYIPIRQDNMKEIGQ